MPFRFGPFELIVLLVIILLIFGPGRLSKIAGEVGKGITEFRKGVGDKKEASEKSES